MEENYKHIYRKTTIKKIRRLKKHQTGQNQQNYYIPFKNNSGSQQIDLLNQNAHILPI